MQKTLLLVILLIGQLAFSQTEKTDYKLYSLVLSEELGLGNKGKVDSLLIIEKFENSIGSINEAFFSKPDSISSSDIAFLSISTGKDTTFLKRLIEEAKFRKSIYQLTSDFGKSPKIEPELLEANQLIIQSITSKKYYSFFGKKFKRKNPWKRIVKKYGTQNIIELSKVKYNENLASLYFGFHCGRICGNGRIVIFEKVRGVWTILTSINQWES